MMPTGVRRYKPLPSTEESNKIYDQVYATPQAQAVLMAARVRAFQECPSRSYMDYMGEAARRDFAQRETSRILLGFTCSLPPQPWSQL